MLRLEISILDSLFPLLLKLAENLLISQSLRLCNIDIMFGILCLKRGYSIQLCLNDLLLFHLTNKVIGKIVRHDHVHVVRRKSTAAKLDLINLLHDILGQL